MGNRTSNAVTTDNSNALFRVSDHEEEKLAIKGRFVKENNLLWIACRVLNRAEDGSGPRRL